MPRHFLRDDDLTPAEQAEVLDSPTRLKADPSAPHAARRQSVAAIFEKTPRAPGCRSRSASPSSAASR